MHKVVVERPRGGQGWAKKFPRPDVPFDELPRHQGIRRPHRHRKWFTDLLGPLRRWLRAQLGRPWDDVYSEACAVIKADSVVRAHIKTHLLEFVEWNTFMQEGAVWCFHASYNQREIPIAELGGRWSVAYVHPETGLLQAMPVYRRKQRGTPAPHPTERWLASDLMLRRLNGIWFECRMLEIRDGARRFDLVSHELVRTEAQSRLPPIAWVCVAKRQLSHRELRRHGLVNAPAGTQPSPHSVLGGVEPARNPAQRNRNPQPRTPYGKSTAPPRRRTVFSRSPASAARASPLKPRSSAASGSCMATRSCARSSGATTSVRAAPTAAFRNCCLSTGRYDGSVRNYYSRE